jgi:hypothetical protein
MRRISPRRQHESHGITPQPPAPAPEPPPPAVSAAPSEPPAPEAPPRIFWGWRLALFLWAASFVFLFLYEILMTLFHGGGGGQR